MYMNSGLPGIRSYSPKDSYIGEKIVYMNSGFPSITPRTGTYVETFKAFES